MNPTVIRAVVFAVPVSFLFFASAVIFVRRKTAFSLVQFVGAGSLVVVVVAHVCEGLHLFPSMRWGDARSVGHYVDLSAAALGLTLLPTGYLLDRRERRGSTRSRS